MVFGSLAPKKCGYDSGMEIPAERPEPVEGQVAYFFDIRRGWLGVSLFKFDYEVKRRRDDLERLRVDPPHPRLSGDALIQFIIDGETVIGARDEAKA